MEKIEATIDMAEALEALINLFVQSRKYQGNPIDPSDLIDEMIEMLDEDLRYRNH